ncbi:hypothetical protein DUI87_04897 [Hirundo rustica rustica]|uniref:ribonuclease H n=1 Tax=Hirundo rustica rustica TaxID=333673 RepID=A0A3M0KXI6_HIRRU|nr:hypothetical protein DUI87_04897 [Hirundo rustica rustica]
MKDRPVICQWYVASLLSPIRAAVEKAIIHHYMDDVLVCAPNDDVLTHVLDLTINALIVAELKLQESKVQRMPPWQYLGLETGKGTIVPQKFAIKTKIKTLADVHQLCGALNWVRPWLGLTTEDLAPLFELLKGGEELSSSRVLTLEAEKALEKHALPTLNVGVNPRGLHRCEVWQVEVTHVPQFGKQKYGHVSVYTFSGAVFASSHTGEKSWDAIKHLVQAFSFMGKPKALKTDNGPVYRSEEFRSFLQQWEVEQKTGILHSLTDQAVAEKTHWEIKRVLDKQQQVLKPESPSIQLARALFTINFLNCSYEVLNPLIIRHFGGN